MSQSPNTTFTGPTPADVLKLVTAGYGDVILARVRSAIDRSGSWDRSGYLKLAIRVRRTPQGAELVAPTDRLRQPHTRQAFIDMLRVQLGAVR